VPVEELDDEFESAVDDGAAVFDDEVGENGGWPSAKEKDGKSDDS
jgi:hypothetical protein